jgi:ATP-binding cassette, subfamily B, bacterial
MELVPSELPLRHGAGRELFVATLRRQRTRLVGVLGVTVVSAVATGLVPVLVQRAIDDGAVAGDRSTLIATMVWFGVVALVGSIANGLRLWLVTRIGQHALHEIRVRATRRIASLPLGHFERLRRGDLVARVTSDVERLESGVAESIPVVVATTVSALAATFGLAVVSPVLAAVTLVVVPPLVLVTRWMLRCSHEVYPRARRVNGEMVAELTETAEGAAVIRAFGRGAQRHDRFSAVNARAASANLDGMRMRVRFFAGLTMSRATTVAAVLAVAGTLALEGRMSVGVVAAGVIAALRVIDSVAELAEYADSIQSMRAALDRVAAVVEIEEAHELLTVDAADASDGGGGVDDGNVARRSDASHAGASGVSVRAVNFGYVPGREVLHDVDLVVPAGSSVAIVGASGAGKSTLARLVTGLATPSTGAVRVAGHDVGRLPPPERRRIVVTVLQEGFCIDGTLADNVRLAAPHVDDVVIASALDRAAGTWWRSIPGGLGAQVGPGGSRLSAGQRQLLGLARVVLLDPEVIVLDEATSLLDPISEGEVADALERTFAGRTVIVIAHRRATAARTGRVIRLERGTVIADGPPEDVLGEPSQIAAPASP